MANSPVAAHGHHWEVSWAPLLAVAGTFFLVPMGFSSYFVYGSGMMAMLFAGIGVPLLVAGIAIWVNEGMTHKGLVEGASTVALPIFIVSEIFIFLSLFASYWMMRLKLDAWPPAGTPYIDITLPIIMTVILVSSSFTIHVAEVKLAAKDMGGYKSWLIITILLGSLFLGCTIYEYSHLAHQGFVPSTNAYSTAFFSITGFHASHVLVGIGVFITMLIPALGGRANESFLTCGSIYWHFVDIVWFFVASQVYFW